MKSYTPWIIELQQVFEQEHKNLRITLPLGQSSFAELLQDAQVQFEERYLEHYQRIRMHAQKSSCRISNHNDELTVAVNHSVMEPASQITLEPDAVLQIGLLSGILRFEGLKVGSALPSPHMTELAGSDADAQPHERQHQPPPVNLDEMSWDDLIQFGSGPTQIEAINPHRLQNAVLSQGDAPNEKQEALSPELKHAHTRRTDPIHSLLSEYWAVKQNRSLLAQEDVLRQYHIAQASKKQDDDLQTLAKQANGKLSLFDILGDKKEESSAILELDPHTRLETFSLFDDEKVEDVLDLFDKKMAAQNHQPPPIPEVTQREHHLLSLDSVMALAQIPKQNKPSNPDNKESS